MKRIHGGKELLLKVKNEVKRQDNRRVKRLLKRHAKKLVGIPGASPVLSPEISTIESPNQK
jgi:hypothetical protein